MYPYILLHVAQRAHNARAHAAAGVHTYMKSVVTRWEPLAMALNSTPSRSMSLGRHHSSMFPDTPARQQHVKHTHTHTSTKHVPEKGHIVAKGLPESPCQRWSKRLIVFDTLSSFLLLIVLNESTIGKRCKCVKTFAV